MDSSQVLVIDHSPERAEEINSLLRNSGIIIRTSFAQTLAEAEKAVDSNRPLLLVYNSTANENVPVSDILQLAEKHGLKAAVRFSPEDPSVLIEAMTFHSCHAINSEEDDHLVKLVRHLQRTGQADHEIETIRLKMEELQSRYNLLLDSSREAIAYIHEGLHIYANPAYLKLVHMQEFSEIAAVSLLELVQSEENDLKQILRKMNDGDIPTEAVRVSVVNPEGSPIDADLIFSAARYDGEDCIQMLVQQVDEHAALQDELERLRRLDPVTQLANRKVFTESVTAFIESDRSSTDNCAVFYLETDGASELHGQLGSTAWDLIMTEFAGVVRHCKEDDDLAARYNDNGIVILATRKDKGQLQSLGECIVSAMDKHVMEIADQTVTTTCSVGMAMVGALTRSADEAMKFVRSAYTDAASEGNQVRRYKPATSDPDPGSQDAQWVDRIRYALDNRDLYSVQQSIVNLEGESEGLFENRTFMREEAGDIGEDEFMPYAENNDLGATIDRHIISGLLAAIAGTGDRHIINLSVNSLLDFSFPSWFVHQLEEHEVQGSQIVLQLSAPNVAPNLKPAKRLIEELSQAKCTFSLSAFDDQRRIISLLDHLDVSMLKLRAGLTDKLTNNSAHQDIVRNVVSSADSKQVSVISDEVKDAAELAVLWQCGVKLVSGDFLKESTQVAS